MTSYCCSMVWYWYSIKST